MLLLDMPGLRPLGGLPLKAQSLFRRSLGVQAPSYRPLGLDLSLEGSSKKRLGQSLPTIGLGPTLSLLAVGAGGFYIADIFPAPASSVLKVAGIAVAGYGIYNIFSLITGSSTVKAAPIMSPAAFARISGLISFPPSGSKPDVNSGGWFFTDKIEVNVIWSNQSSEVGNFDFDILVTSVSGPGVVIDSAKKTALKADVITSVTKIVSPSSIRDLAPNNSYPPVTIPISLFQPPDKGTFADLPGQPKPYFNLYLQLRKIGPGGPVPVGNLVQFGPFDFK